MGTDWAEIERMGARARAGGSRLEDNPFLDPACAPAESDDDREAKRDTWSLGWALEDQFRRQIS